MDPIGRSDEAWPHHVESLVRRKFNEEQRARQESSVIAEARASLGYQPSEHDRVRGIIAEVKWLQTGMPLMPSKEREQEAISKLREALRVYNLPDEPEGLKAWLLERGKVAAQDCLWELAELAFNVQRDLVRLQVAPDKARQRKGTGGRPPGVKLSDDEEEALRMLREGRKPGGVDEIMMERGAKRISARRCSDGNPVDWKWGDASQLKRNAKIRTQ